MTIYHEWKDNFKEANINKQENKASEIENVLRHDP